MATVQKISAVLKGAGFERAERGHTRLTKAGFQVSTLGMEEGEIRVAHGAVWSIRERRHVGPNLLPEYAQALVAAGFDVEDKGGWLVVRDKEAR